MNNNGPAERGHADDAVMLDQRQADAIVRVAEAAPGVRRRYQYFVWTQSQLQTLLPHQLLVCGAYVRQRRDLVFEAFHSVVLQPELLALMSDGQGPLLRALQAAWIDGRNRPLLMPVSRLAEEAHREAADLLASHDIGALLVHGVARPQRPAELESFFVFASTGPVMAAAAALHVDLLMPYLHSSWQRVMATEREMGLPPVAAKAAPKDDAVSFSRRITEREREVLKGVAEGKNNQEIGLVLGISQLTVKNHVQKILRKLDCSNRAQAVAQALALGLLRSSGGH